MDDNEFQDLQMFGQSIEVQPEQKSITSEIKKPVVAQLKIRRPKNNYNKYFKKISCFFTKIFRKIAKKIRIKLKDFKCFFNKKISNFNKKIGLWVHNRKIYSLKNSLKQNSDLIGYKIVEFKKEKKNKIVIVRKRIPYILDSLDIKNKKSDVGSLYYLSVHDEDQDVSAESYARLKKSVWDFPHKK